VSQLVNAAHLERSTISSKLQNRAKLRGFKDARTVVSSASSLGSTLETSGGNDTESIADAESSGGPVNNMRYSGPQTILVCTEPPEASVIHQSSVFQYDLRWQEVARLYKLILYDNTAASPARVINDLGDAFQLAATASNSPGRIRRADFLDILETKIVNYARGRANLLFNVFDTKKTGSLEYVQVVGALLMLCFADSPAREKVEMLWVLYQRLCFSKSTMQRVEEIMNTCSQSEEDYAIMQNQLKHVFKPTFYRTVVMQKGDDEESDASEMEEKAVLKAYNKRLTALPKMTQKAVLKKNQLANKAREEMLDDGSESDFSTTNSIQQEVLASTSPSALLRKWDAELKLDKANSKAGVYDRSSRMRARQFHAEGIFGSSPASLQQFLDTVDSCPTVLELFQQQLNECLTLTGPGASDETLARRRTVQVRLRQMKEAEEKLTVTIRQPSRQSTRPASTQKSLKGSASVGSLGKSTLGSTGKSIAATSGTRLMST